MVGNGVRQPWTPGTFYNGYKTNPAILSENRFQPKTAKFKNIEIVSLFVQNLKPQKESIYRQTKIAKNTNNTNSNRPKCIWLKS